MQDQFLIKAVLLVGIGVLAILIVLPGGGARRTALRRIALLLIALLGAIAVIFPDLTNQLAALFGVGRGADLLLYGLVLAFVWDVVTSRIHRRQADLERTELARRIAILSAEQPAKPRR
jgi:hypothetical protein